VLSLACFRSWLQPRRLRRWTRAAAAVALLSACGGGGTSAPSTTVDQGGCAMTESGVANEGWVHVAEGSQVTYRHNPPASGPHYPVWARYQSYTTAVARPYWVHNAALGDALRSLPADPECGHSRALLTPDPLLSRAVTAVAADFVLEGDCVSADAIRRFTAAHRNHGPEDICDSGTRP
jgi:hypothetical protein